MEILHLMAAASSSGALNLEASCGMAGPSSIPKGTPNEKSVRRHDCCDQELLNIIENRRSQKIWWRISEPTLGSDHSRSEVLGCKDDGF
ncbi:hypothetical protein GBA52_015458 [Prunus armeniaca]|nr:hypothetical protein GBA52_015458 [Prunus armeniaca]